MLYIYCLGYSVEFTSEQEKVWHSRKTEISQFFFNSPTSGEALPRDAGRGI